MQAWMLPLKVAMDEHMRRLQPVTRLPLDELLEGIEQISKMTPEEAYELLPDMLAHFDREFTEWDAGKRDTMFAALGTLLGRRIYDRPVSDPAFLAMFAEEGTS